MPQSRYIRERAENYRAVFTTPVGERVLADLSKFCARNVAIAPRSKVTGMIDPIAMAIGVGRKEVWDRIQSQLNLDERQLAQMEQFERELRAQAEAEG